MMSAPSRISLLLTTHPGLGTSQPAQPGRTGPSPTRFALAFPSPPCLLLSPVSRWKMKQSAVANPCSWGCWGQQAAGSVGAQEWPGSYRPAVGGRCLVANRHGGLGRKAVRPNRLEGSGAERLLLCDSRDVERGRAVPLWKEIRGFLPGEGPSRCPQAVSLHEGGMLGRVGSASHLWQPSCGFCSEWHPGTPEDSRGAGPVVTAGKSARSWAWPLGQESPCIRGGPALPRRCWDKGQARLRVATLASGGS